MVESNAFEESACVINTEKTLSLKKLPPVL
jgi:hypothetical protein